MQLNKHMQPIGSPVDQKTKINTSVGFNIENKRSAVSASRVKNLTFDQASGGTLTLGGLSNGEGVLRILNSAGGTAVFANNQGIEIFDGNITIANGNGQTILDTSGVVSSTTFPSNQVFSGSSFSTNSTSYIDLAGSTLDPFVLSRTTRVLISVEGLGYNNTCFNTTHNLQLACVDSVDGDIIDFPITGVWQLDSVDFVGESYSVTTSDQFSSITSIHSFGAGTHTMKLQYKVNGGGTAFMDTFLFNYIILGS